ncbi:hypothetical protein ACLOJK_026873 [Asimina triloba]
MAGFIAVMAAVLVEKIGYDRRPMLLPLMGSIHRELLDVTVAGFGEDADGRWIWCSKDEFLTETLSPFFWPEKILYRNMGCANNLVEEDGTAKRHSWLIGEEEEELDLKKMVISMLLIGFDQLIGPPSKGPSWQPRLPALKRTMEH